MDTTITHIQDLWKQAIIIWIAGGWCMPGIAFSGLIMFALGLHVHMKLGQKRFLSIPEATWRRWIDHPELRKGPIGEMLDFVSGNTSIKAIAACFDELRTTEVAPFERDLRVMKICVTVSPLLGLLGTVTGMLATFNALATGSGGEKTMALVAKGISEALITTETGLVVALPGIFFQYQLSRKHDRYKAFLAHVEIAYTQKLHKMLNGKESRQ